MLQHRCPWCGEKISFLDNLIRFFSRSEGKCPFCGNRIQINIKHYKKRFFFLGIVSCLISSLCLTLSRIYHRKSQRFMGRIFSYSGFLLILCFVLLDFRIPLTRQGEFHKKCTSVKLNWYRQKQGILFPRFNVLNGEIFPACFLNPEGNPISTPICVVLENLKWEKGRRCRCTIQVVLDEVSEEGLFCPGNRLYLYHNRKKIAEGEII